jgi:hypothetical protein
MRQGKTYVSQHAEENIDDAIGRADTALDPYYIIIILVDIIVTVVLPGYCLSRVSVAPA